MIRGGQPKKKENVANRYAQERIEHLFKLISSYGGEGVDRNYIIAFFQYQHGVDSRKTKELLNSLLWMGKIRTEKEEGKVRAPTMLYAKDIEVRKTAEQVDLEGRPTTFEEVKEGEGVLELLSRVRTHSTSSPSPESQNNPTDQRSSA